MKNLKNKLSNCGIGELTMIVQKIEKRPVDVDIIGATILSVEEAEKLPTKLRMYSRPWWLRSPGTRSFFASYVYGDSVIKDGYNVNFYFCTRPALQIANSSGLKIGDIFEFGELDFQVISDKLAFCLGDIGYIFFRNDWQAENANNYDKSDVKMAIDSWFNEAKEEN